MMVSPYFPIEEYESRWARVQAEMKRRGYDAAVVWGRSAGGFERCADLLYLVNYYSTNSGQQPDSTKHHGIGFNAVILQEGQKPELVADEPPREDLVATDRHRWSLNPIQGVVDALRERNIGGRVAMAGSDFMPIKYWPEIQKGTPNIDWQFEDELVQPARLIKSARELDCFREGGEICTRALELLIGGLKAGKSEAAAAAEAGAEVIRHGGSFHMMPVSHGETIDFFCRNPLNGYSTDVPAKGDVVRGWVYGPIHQGYWLDPGRTTVCGGKPSDSQRELIEACANLVETVGAAIKPGAKVKDVAAVGDRLMEEFGGKEDQAHQKWPLYGHGNGLFWEHPWLASDLGDEEFVYDKDMVVSSEAFLSREGVGAAGFEQNYIVTETGTELLDKTPMLWWD
jgi:Xaa-Pro aminopeptidase